MTSWLEDRLSLLRQRHDQVSGQLSEIGHFLENNTSTIQGSSIELTHLTDGVDRPYHAIQTWRSTVSQAKHLLRSGESSDSSRSLFGDFK